MKPRLFSVFRTDPAWSCFLAFAFFSMISMPVARLLILCSFAAVLLKKSERRRLRVTGPTFGWLCYLALAIVVSGLFTLFCTDALLVPAKGFGKIPKLFWYAAIPLGASLLTTRDRARELLRVMVAGATVLAVWMIVCNPVLAWLQVYFPTPEQLAQGTDLPAAAAFLQTVAASLHLDGAIHEALCSRVWEPWGGRPPAFFYAFINLGEMGDAQRLMIALIFNVVLLLTSRKDAVQANESGRFAALWKRPAWRIFSLFVITFALVMTCKRGPVLLGFASCLGVLILMRVKPLVLLGSLLLAVCLLFSLPSMRTRLCALPREWSVQSGGRALMWTKIVPALAEEHPYGIGFRSLTAEKMESIDPRIEPNRTHVHSSVLQAYVDFGKAGLCVYALWMALCFSAGFSLLLEFWNGGKTAELLAPPLAFAALFCFSLVEYNIADADVVILYALILGLCSPLYRRMERKKCDIVFLEKVFLKPHRDGMKLRGVEIFNLSLVRELAAEQKTVLFPVHPSWKEVISTETGNSGFVRLLPVFSFGIPALGCLFAGVKVWLYIRQTAPVRLLFVANNVNGLIPEIRFLMSRNICEKLLLFAHKFPSSSFLNAVRPLPGEIVCVCEAIAGGFRAAKPRANVSVCYGITHADAFFPALPKPAHERVRFCLMGDLDSAWKGADTAISAFSLLKPELRTRAELHLKAFPEKREFPEETHIFAHPWTDVSEIPAFLQSMDVMLALSRNHADGRMSETFSQVVVQGMLCALPVIYTSLPPFVEKFDVGGGLNADTPEQIAAAMERLILSASEREKMGKTARQTAQERYVWSTSDFFRRYL